MFKHMILSGALAAASLSVNLQAETVAKVGGDSVSREEFEAKVKFEEAQLKRGLSKPERSGLLRSIVNQRLLVAEAKRNKFDREAGFKTLMVETERKALADRVFNEQVLSKAQVSPEGAKKFYEENPLAFDVAQVSQIFIAVTPGKEAEAEKKALALKAALSAAPKTFAAVANVQSDDAQTKSKGGDLGPIRRKVLVDELDQAVFSSKLFPAILGPVRSAQGIHIVQVRSVKRLKWSEVSGTLQQELQQASSANLQQALIEALAKKDKVTLFEDKL